MRFRQKTPYMNLLLPEIAVAPYLGAWIEIIYPSTTKLEVGVAPYLGAWIEINFDWGGIILDRSHLT